MKLIGYRSFALCYASSSSASAFSSMLMSLSSLDSKTSRHSRHSTNSASSSRLTICTRGCLQGCFSALCGREDGCGVINPGASPLFNRAEGQIRGIPGILALLCHLSSPDRYSSVNFFATPTLTPESKGEIPTKSVAQAKLIRARDLPFGGCFLPLPAKACVGQRRRRRMNYDRKGRRYIRQNQSEFSNAGIRGLFAKMDRCSS